MCNINFRHLHIANNNLTRKTLFSVKSKVKILIASHRHHGILYKYRLQVVYRFQSYLFL